jgi:uncharacterized protein with HEPN domain
MPSEPIAQSLRDIVGAIQLIRESISRVGTIEAAIQDAVIRSAIERQLLIVSEAAIRIDHRDPDFAPANAPEVEWSGVRGIGNFIRHRYDDLDTQIVLNVLKNRIDGLEAACERLLRL